MNLRIKISFRLIVTHIVLIVGLVVASLLVTNCDFLFLSITQTVLLIVYFSGYWEFFGLKFKRIFFSITELVLAGIFAYKLLTGFSGNINWYLFALLAVIQVFLLIELIRILIVIFKKDDLYMDIEFPFKHGNYLITDGGNSKMSRLMNYHYYAPIHKKNKTNMSMLYATDIVKLGGGKLEWLPKKNGKYPIFNEKIYSPIDGRIVKMENDIDDNEPFQEHFPYNTGNTLVIQKDNYYFLLGHLKKGSIVVNVGDIVQANDLISAVGNSGWTERPHIHIQLIKSETINYWSGTGVEIRYKNKTLIKNRLIKN